MLPAHASHTYHRIPDPLLHQESQLFSRSQIMNGRFNRWALGNAYGAFGSIAGDRHEVVVEGWDGCTWRKYGFHGKPGDPARLPRQFSPYHLRLDPTTCGWIG